MKIVWRDGPRLLRAEVWFLGVGLALSGWLAYQDRSLLMPAITFALIAGILPVVFLILGSAVGVHEAGHALVARAVGFRVTSFRVLGIEFLVDGVERPSPYPLGSVHVSDGEESRKGRWIAFVAAGPLANLAVGALLYGAGRFAGGEWFVTFFPLILTQVILGVFSLIPVGNLVTDGDKILDLMGPRPELLAIRSLTRLLAHTELPREYDATDRERLTWLRHPLRRFYGLQRSLYHAIDCGQGAEACSLARDLVENAPWSQIPEVLRIDAYLEAAFCLALYERNVAEAEALLEEVEEIPRAMWPTARRVDVALLDAQGRSEEARTRFADAREALAHEPDETPRATEEAFLAQLRLQVATTG